MKVRVMETAVTYTADGRPVASAKVLATLDVQDGTTDVVMRRARQAFGDRYPGHVGSFSHATDGTIVVTARKRK
jgi:hypothetical protein